MMTTNCPACGVELVPTAIFCPQCGKMVGQVAPPNVVPPPLNTPPPITISSPGSPPPPPLLNPSAFTSTPPALLLTAAPQPTPEMEFIPAIPPPPIALEQVRCVVGMVTRKTGIFSSILYHLVVTDKRLIFAHQTNEMKKLDVMTARSDAKQAGKNVFGQIGAQMSTRSGEKYFSLAPDSILAENPNNFMIPLAELKVIETYSGDFEENAPDTMVVKSLSDKITFTIGNAHSVKQHLKPVLGDRVK